MKQLKDLSSVLRGLPPSPLIVLHSACAQPRRLASLLASCAGELRGARILALMPMDDAPYASPAVLGHAEVMTFFPGKGLRAASKAGDVRVTRVPLSRICALFDTGALRADLLLLHLSPAGTDGIHSLGVSVDYMRSVLAQDPVVVAEIDEGVPFTLGETGVAAIDIDFVLPSDAGLVECAAPRESAIDGRIADHVAALVPHGAILQVGIGAIPELTLARLGHLQRLGIHSGTLTDAVLPLLHKGNVTNATNTLNPGRSTTTMLTGSRELNRFAHRNAQLELRSCRDTHDPAKLATLPKLYAINSALQADLTGAVDGESADGAVIAGPGGLPDFAQGASLSEGGASIVALRSTSRDGKRSSIHAGPGGMIRTVEGEHVDYLVTEFGAARLTGLAPADRARAIIAVAHPDFRRDLAARTGD